jgi:hypothetical protein
MAEGPDNKAIEITPAMIEAGAYIIEAATGCLWGNALDAARDVFAIRDDAGTTEPPQPRLAAL